MTCDEIMDLMQRSLDQELTAAEEQAMLAHLHGCPGCTDLYERLKRLSDELMHMPKITPPYSIVDSIMPRLEELDGFTEPGAASDSAGAAPSARDTVLYPNDELEARRKRKGIFSWKIASGVAAAGIVLGVLLLNGGPGRLSNQAADGLLDGKNQKIGSAATSAGAAAERTAPAPAAAADTNAAVKEISSVPGKEVAETSPQAGSSAASSNAAAKTAATPSPAATPAAQTSTPAHAGKEVTAASSGEALRSAETSGGTEAAPSGENPAKPKSDEAPQATLAAPSAAPASTPAPKAVESSPAAKEAGDAAAASTVTPEGSAPSAEEKSATFNTMRSLVPPAAASSAASMTSADGRYTASIVGQSVQLTLADGSLWFRSPVRIGEGETVTFHGWSEGIFVYSIRGSDGQERTYRIIAETKTEATP